jgi:uncharacterized membrane protein YdjX (TVP38/TMEM64 family)
MVPVHQNKHSINRHIRFSRLFLGGAIIVLGLYGTYQLTQLVAVDAQANAWVQQFGYVGVLLISFLTGLSAVSPIPTGVFTPIFTEAGLWLPLIVATMVVGTTFADLTAYLMAFVGRTVALEKYPTILRHSEALRQKSRWYIITGMTIWAAMVPLPNELPLIACALIGVRLRVLLLPLMLGTLVFHALFSIGTLQLFEWL